MLFRSMHVLKYAHCFGSNFNRSINIASSSEFTESPLGSMLKPGSTCKPVVNFFSRAVFSDFPSSSLIIFKVPKARSSNNLNVRSLHSMNNESSSQTRQIPWTVVVSRVISLASRQFWPPTRSPLPVPLSNQIAHPICRKYIVGRMAAARRPYHDITPQPSHLPDYHRRRSSSSPPLDFSLRYPTASMISERELQVHPLVPESIVHNTKVPPPPALLSPFHIFL